MITLEAYNKYIETLEKDNKIIEKKFDPISVENELSVTITVFSGCNKPKLITYLTAYLHWDKRKRYNAQQLIEYYNRNHLCQFVLWDKDEFVATTVVDAQILDIVTTEELNEEVFGPQFAKLMTFYNSKIKTQQNDAE